MRRKKPRGELAWWALDQITVALAVLFLAFFVIELVFTLTSVHSVFARPIELCIVMLALIMVRVHVPDCLRNGLRSTIALFRENGHIILPFLGLIMLTFVTALLPGSALAPGGATTKTIFILAYRFFVLLGAISIAILLRDKEWRLILVLLLLVLVGSVFYDLANPGTFSTVGSRAAGFLRNPNVSAITLTMITAMLLRYDRFHAFDALMIFICFLAVMATLSRGGMLLIAVLILNYIVLIGRKNWTKHVLVLPLVILVIAPLTGYSVLKLTSSFDIFTSENAQRRLATLTFNNQSNAVYETDDIRIGLMSTYMKYISEAPIFGHGVGFSHSLPYRPHNMYLEFWVNSGIIAVVLYIWFLLSLLILSWQRGFLPGVVFTEISIVGGFFDHTIAQWGSFLILAGLTIGLSWCLMVQSRSSARNGRSRASH